MGQRVAYIEGWRLVDLANSIFGFNGWSHAVTSTNIDFIDFSSSKFYVGVSILVDLISTLYKIQSNFRFANLSMALWNHIALSNKCYICWMSCLFIQRWVPQSECNWEMELFMKTSDTVKGRWLNKFNALRSLCKILSVELLNKTNPLILSAILL